ncbi:MAG: hypothetical protein J2P37_26985 [Ktedonobacteraceae bacterium]|nr:hypothetical protein [Ktedonobacteraceae bacterium]
MSRGDFSNSEVYNGGGVDRNGPSHYNEGGSFNLRAAALHDGAQSAQTDLVGKLGEGYQVDIQSIESGKKGTARIVEEHGTSHLVMQEKGSAGEPVRNISIEITNGDIAKALDQVKSALDGSRSSDASSSATETTRPDVAIPGGFKILDVTEFRNAAAQGYKGLSPTDTVPDGIPRPDAAATSDAQRQAAQREYSEVYLPQIREAEKLVNQAQGGVSQFQRALESAGRNLDDINKAYHKVASEKGEEAARAETEQTGNKYVAEMESARGGLEQWEKYLADCKTYQNEVAAWAADFRGKWGLEE